MKSAVVVSLGALSKVDNGPFIKKINEAYKPDKKQASDLLLLCREFNQGKHDKDSFKKKFFETLKVEKAPSDDEFWKDWNAMLTIEAKGINEKLSSLKKAAEKNNAIVYLISDTNPVQFDEIMTKSKDLKISKTTSGQKTLNDTPLFLTYDYGASRPEIVKTVLDQMNKKEFKIDGKIHIIHGDPNNHTDDACKTKAAEELRQIKALGADNDNIVVHLHYAGAPFGSLLAKVFPSEAVVEQLSSLKIA